MNWTLSYRADTRALPLADRHYNRQKVGSPQFVPPGRCLVLLAPGALWVTSWPFAEFTKHEWAGAWVNSLFRRESGEIASTLIREALAATRWYWGDPPALGLITFIDREKVRRKRDFGRCYLRAGFTVRGETKGGLLAVGIDPRDMPEAEPPTGAQERLFMPIPALAQHQHPEAS